MAATIARPHVYEAFLAPATQSHQFFHGHTFAGNPLAAAAAIASIELFQQENLVATIDEKSKRLRRGLEPLADHPHVGDIRGRGLMVGIELVADRDTRTCFDPAEQIGRKICRRALDRGVWIRPLSDVIILMPPLVASDDELDLLANVVVDSIQTELAVSRNNVLASADEIP